MAAVVANRRQPDERFADVIAAAAHAHRFDSHTRNPGDFSGLEELVRVIPI
ncbi:MAG: cytotoxic translational repressor of toxin-antitoxin stability system, toxin of TAS system [Mycobacterium sp.]